MPQSLSATYLHLVFSTKDRAPHLRDPVIRAETHAYLGGISKQLDCQPIIIGGVEDHVHILARRRQSRRLAREPEDEEFRHPVAGGHPASLGCQTSPVRC